MNLQPLRDYWFNLNRRQLLKSTVGGGLSLLGQTALAELLANEKTSKVDSTAKPELTSVPGLPGLPHFAPKAKRVIYLYMEGAPSQVDTFDYKPLLADQFNKDLPDSIRGSQRLTRYPVAPALFPFSQHDNNENGLWVCDLLQKTGQMAKELCVVKSMVTEQINHGPGITFMQTGHLLPGRPAIGAWLSYGLGSSNANLPTFVVMISQGRGQMQALFSHLWGAGFLPGEHQGVQFRAGSDPVLFLSDPAGLRRDDRRKVLDMIGELNRHREAENKDAEVLSRIAQYEMAYRMQMSIPDLADFKEETQATLDAYGPDVQKPGSYAYNCLLARRMAERGVRFIQLYHRGWDHHFNVGKDLPMQCQDVDQPQAALLRDLRQRGLLDETLVVWGGEFGRTVYCQGDLLAKQYGRDHHACCFSTWMAGGGIKPGITYGQTDDFSYNIVENKVTAHDLHATLLHCLGIDHTRLTYKYQGLDFRLSGVEPARVLTEILA